MECLELRESVIFDAADAKFQSKTQIQYSEEDVTLYRFSEWKQNLPSEHMTVVSRRRTVNHNPVTVVQLLDFKISTELLCEITFLKM